MYTREKYKAIEVGVNATEAFDGRIIGGFIAKTAGTVTITAADGTVVVNAFPVTAGNTLPLPFILPNNQQGGTVTTAGGASGILAV